MHTINKKPTLKPQTSQLEIVSNSAATFSVARVLGQPGDGVPWSVMTNVVFLPGKLSLLFMPAFGEFDFLRSVRDKQHR